LSKLLGFDFRVEFKPGWSNVVADALSRRDTEDTSIALALSAPMFQLFDDIRSKLAHDPMLCGLCDDVRAGQRGTAWQFTDDLITVVGRVYMPPPSLSVQAALAVVLGAGHEGVEKTLHRLHRDFFVPVCDHVRTCAVCQQN
jgi:hypothetical protein